MYERVNLYYLYTASKINIRDYRIYEKILSNREKITNLGEREKGSIYYLVDLLLVNNCSFDSLDNFYYSYTIPHIGKEFDLLKISNEKILNIELKSENVGLERIKTQLLTNYKYLKYLNKKMYLFTFVSDSKTFYMLNEEKELMEIEFIQFYKVFNSFSNDAYVDIDALFKTSDFLVSPNTEPYKFINGQYFLTTQQDFIKDRVLEQIKKHNIFKITGEAGTGKTLLLFDMARKLAKDSSVLIINCNKPNKNHIVIGNEISNLTILSMVELLNNVMVLDKFDIILLDEAQRMNKALWNILNAKLDKKIIFTLDPKQVLTKEEIKSNYSSLIDELAPVKHRLSNRIRINNSIKNFTYRLFDLSLKNYPLDLTDVNICFASNINELNKYLEIYSNEYTYIKVPNANYNSQVINTVEISDVVGKDYENVIMILDNNYFYKNGKLSSYNSIENDYLYLKILYQGLSRTREKITLIIYKNKGLFKEILENTK